MSQNRKWIGLAVIIFFIVLPSWFGLRMNQQRQQNQRAAAERRRQEQALIQTRRQSAGADMAQALPNPLARLPVPDPPLVRLQRVGQIPGTQQGLQGDLAVQGQYVFWSLAGRLRVIDVSEPSEPRVVGTLEIENMAEWVRVSGRYAYVMDERRLLVVDVSDPSAPRVAGSRDLGVDWWGAAVHGEHAYVTSAGSVHVIDVSDPAAPREVGRGAVDCGGPVTVAGQYAYVACGDYGMHVVDISDPQAPKQVGTFRGTDGARDVTVAGKHAYITGMENDVFGLYIVDVSDPTSPKQIVRYGDWMTGGVAVQGRYAYLASGNLSVLDVANPSAPKEVGFFQAPDDPATVAWRVAVAGDYVYVLGDGKQGFSILRAVWTDREGKE